MTLTWDEAVSGKVNEERTATLTFKDNDVRAVYIDWDDGESNKKEEANYQWIQLTEPKTSHEAKHTYNKSGNFYPVVQLINSRGFVSRYYANEDSNTDVTPFSKDTGIQPCKANDAEPLAFMKVENTLPVAGIDNSILEVEGAKKVYVAIAPTLSGPELTGTVKGVNLSIEAVTHRNKFDADNGVESQIELGSLSKQETFTFTINLTTAANQYAVYDFFDTMNELENATFSKILKFKFNSCKATYDTSATDFVALGTDYTTNEIFNRLKIFLVTKAADGKFYPITYVSAGSPIKSVDDNQHFSIMDMGQSRAAASNIAISDYRYDNGKGWFSPVEQWSLSTNILGTGTSIGTNTQKPLHYSYLVNPYGINGNSTTSRVTQEVFRNNSESLWYVNADDDNKIRQDSVALDDYGRFYDQYYMVRNSVVAGGLSGSIVTTNQPEVFLCQPSPNWTGADSITTTNVTDYTSKMKNNGETNVMKLSSINTTPQLDVVGTDVTTQDAEYIILTFDNKTNKVGFNISNYANGLISGLSGFTNVAGFKIAGVEYLHVDNHTDYNQNAYWKPLEFKDTTRIEREVTETTEKTYQSFHNSLAKSGFISYDMPTDWTAASIKDLCGGVYNTSSGTLNDCIATGSDDVLVTGTVSAGASPSGYGSIYNISGSDVTTKMQAKFGTGDSAIAEVGRYKYVFIVTDAPSAALSKGSAFWIGSGSSDGWNGTTTLSIQVGTADSSPAFNSNYEVPAITTITGNVRRINIYDSIVGSSKVFAINSTTNVAGQQTATGNAELITVGGQYYNNGTSYFKNQYNANQAAFTGSSWATNAKYVLRITLSGTTSNGDADNACPEVWNVFDATRSNTVTLKSTDDSGYNLNSLAITSDVAMRRTGVYYRAITRQGKTFILKTGIGLEQIGFSSKALGDESNIKAWTESQSSSNPASMYGHLHMIRKLQADSVPVYWDEPQKDGTYIRIWGIVSNLNETRSVGGPRAPLSYTFNVIIKDIALINTNGELMTDRFAIGGIQNERTYS
jgi:hypothetical protein